MAAMPREECARRLGDSPSKRMAASWSRFSANLTEYKVAVRLQHPNGELPPDDRTARTIRKDYAYGKRLTLESPYKTFPFPESVSKTAQKNRPRLNPRLNLGEGGEAMIKSLKSLVGTTGFEPATPTPPV
jgi:hypothetical protein